MEFKVNMLFIIFKLCVILRFLLWLSIPLISFLKKINLMELIILIGKRNLDIVLTTEDYKFVLTNLCSPKPHERATEQEAKPYKKWVKVNEMSRCSILASMSNILQHQHHSMPTAYDMMMNLKECLGIKLVLLGRRL